MENPTVAVIVPTYNRWPHVCVAIDSVLGQDYPQVECVVVDDGSTDGTADQLRRRYGSRVRLLAKATNEEKCAARNDGVLATAAQYVCMCDSDDELTRDSVGRRVQLFLDDPGFDGVAYGVSDRGRGVDLGRHLAPCFNGDTLDAYLESPFLDNNCFLLSRANMLKHGMYSVGLTNREDVELLVRLMCRLPFRFCGAAVARVRRVDASARINYGKILAQDRAFTRILFAHADVLARLGEAGRRKLLYEECMMLALACYRERRHRRFRQLCRELTGEYGDLLERPLRLRKRYWLSWLLQPWGK